MRFDSSVAKYHKLGPGRIKHVEIAALAIKEMVRRRILLVEHLSGELNTADIHTKHLKP